jgi:dsDNA-binding SOS-regulon protein
LKIITHTTYTYETYDGREFDDKAQAEAWKRALDTAAHIARYLAHGTQ